MAEGVTPSSAAPPGNAEAPFATRGDAGGVLDYQPPPAPDPSAQSPWLTAIIFLLRITLSLGIGVLFVIGALRVIMAFVMGYVGPKPFEWDVLCGGLGMVAGAVVAFYAGDRFIRWLHTL